jgi:NTE family protein
MTGDGRKQIGLALGGGGSRGFAHIGVLKVFEDESIPVDIIAGSSIGAVIGGAYASGLKPADLIGKVAQITESPLAQLSVFKVMGDAPAQEMGIADKIGLFFKSQWLFAQALFNPGMMGEKDFQEVIDHFVPDIRIEDTKIPFRAVATDLKTGTEVVLSEGSLRRAVLASCAVPGFMPPVREGEMLLVDGGTVNILPCSVARSGGADIVIGIDVDRDISAGGEFSNAIDIYTRAAEIGSFHLANLSIKEADLVIRPKVGHVKWFDLSNSMEIIEEGERCAREELERVKELVTAARGKAFVHELRKFLKSIGILRS